MQPPLEQTLTGGNVADVVVRIGSTVRKPVTPSTPGVQALLRHLTEAGFTGSPQALGYDDAGRQVIEYVPGECAIDLPALTGPQLGRLGRMIRDLHDALATFVPAPDVPWDVVIAPDREDLICHHDLAPWNLVLDGERWVFIDWDAAGPGSRLWDLGYSAQSFVPLLAGGDPAVDGPRLRALVDGYGLDEQQRREFPAIIAGHTRGMFELLRQSSLTGRQPWSRLWAEGHGEHWGPAADYVQRHHDYWVAAL